MQNMYIVHRMASVLQHLEPRAFFMWDDSKKVCLLIKQALFIHQCIDGARVLTLHGYSSLSLTNTHTNIQYDVFITTVPWKVTSTLWLRLPSTQYSTSLIFVCVCKNGVCPIRASYSLLPHTATGPETVPPKSKASSEQQTHLKNIKTRT